HDRFTEITKERADAYAVASQRKAAAAWDDGVMRETVVPMAVFTDEGWKVADRDEFLRRDTTLQGPPARRPPLPPGGPAPGRDPRGAARRRHRLPARVGGGRRRARPRPEAAARRLRVRRSRAGADGNRADPGDAQGARAHRPHDRRDRSLRAQRAFRGPGAD